MNLDELKDYAAEKYRLKEIHKWPEFPEFSVLVREGDEKFAALLMKVWDEETGEVRELMDLRFPRELLPAVRADGIGNPYRMRGSNWIGICFDEVREEGVICRLFDQAMRYWIHSGNTIVLTSSGPQEEGEKRAYYQDTLIPSGESAVPWRRGIPDRILKMMSLVQVREGSFREKCRNFYVQGKFMEDYEDDMPWDGRLERYYLTYHDLKPEQLRGYFTWRTNVRKGIYEPACRAFGLLYLYELLSGIGTADPEDSLRKINVFEQAYQEAFFRGIMVDVNLSEWKRDFSILKNIDRSVAEKYVEFPMVKLDHAVHVLQNADHLSDQEVFEALKTWDPKVIEKSQAVKKDREEAMRLYALLWRASRAKLLEQGKDLFALMFGTLKDFGWRPLANAVFWQETPQEDREYVLDECRSFVLRSGYWKERCYFTSYDVPKRIHGFIHEAERVLRNYLGIRRPMKPGKAEHLLAAVFETILEEDRRAKIEAAKPKIVINTGNLDLIRRDALKTRDSLLTEEEKQEMEEMTVPAPVKEEPAAEGPLSPRQREILKMLVNGQSVRETLRAENEMAELFAESVNEALFEEIGDVAVECSDEELFLIEDYREDVLRILGGLG
ncbi:MAG: TerB N-terminal domain-containing protein [Solobacterium sp.]|nr:TerB N-terminal domain-containing protein [Solobacterium sp.]